MQQSWFKSFVLSLSLELVKGTEFKAVQILLYEESDLDLIYSTYFGIFKIQI